MNKTVLINIAGKVFHIEEDAYKLIMDYDQSIRNYFKEVEDGIEIISDIESRIAELINEELSRKKKAIIQMEEVEYIIKRLGKVADFQYETGKETGSKENADPNFFSRKLYRDPLNKMIGGVCSGLSNYFGIDTTIVRLLFLFFMAATLIPYIIMCIIIPKAKTKEDFVVAKNVNRRLFRDPDHKMLGGVCSGVAAYLDINVTWIRLIFIVLSIPIFGVFWIGGISFFMVIFYFILWAIVPLARTDDEKKIMKGDWDSEDTINASLTPRFLDIKRKFYRDPDNKVLGGVCAGIASYFGLDVILVRLVFIFLSLPILGKTFYFDFFSPSFAIVPTLYLILWLIVPEAKTVADKVAMRGDSDDLDGIVKNIERHKSQNAFLDNVIQFIANIIKITFKLTLIVAGVLLICLSILSVIALVIVSVFYLKGSGYLFENYQLFVGLNRTLLLIGSLVFLGVPALALLWLGLKISVNIKSINKKINFSLLGVWVLSFALLLYLSVVGALSFKERANMEESHKMKEYKNYYVKFTDNNVTHLELENGITRVLRIDIPEKNRVNFYLEKSQDQHASISKEFRAYGKNGEDAIRNAENIHYEIERQDSLIILPTSFALPNNDLWRNQIVSIKIMLPLGSNIIIDKRNSWRFGLSSKYSTDNEQQVWTMTENGLVYTGN